MAQGSGVALRIETDAVPVLDEASAMYERGMTTGVNKVNRQLVAEKTRYERELPRWREEIFVDPQTSGGLLVSVSQQRADELVEALHEAGVTTACRIGTVGPFEGQHRLIFS